MSIVINGIRLAETPRYGCHSENAPELFKKKVVYHSSGNPGWLHRMSEKCRYDQKGKDSRCEGCTHPYDDEYVEGLK